MHWERLCSNRCWSDWLADPSQATKTPGSSYGEVVLSTWLHLDNIYDSTLRVRGDLPQLLVRATDLLYPILCANQV